MKPTRSIPIGLLLVLSHPTARVLTTLAGMLAGPPPPAGAEPELATRRVARWPLLAAVPPGARQPRRRLPGRRAVAVEPPHHGRRERPHRVAWPLRPVMCLQRRVRCPAQSYMRPPRHVKARTQRQLRPRWRVPKARRPRRPGPAALRLDWAGSPGSGFRHERPPSRHGPAAPVLELAKTACPALAPSKVRGPACLRARCRVSMYRPGWRSHRHKSPCPGCPRG